MKVSVIIPIYNAEKYLEECLESLVHQTMPADEIELLAVNDCSTDGSRAILERYALQYPQLHILQTEINSGAGGARNIGLAAAQGDYIGFVDSDDAVVPAMFEHLYQTAEAGDFDIVDSGIYYQSKDQAIVHTADEDTGVQTDEKRSHNIVSGGYLVTRIFRRTLWEKSGLQFRKNAILEDMEILMHLTATAGRIGNLKEICYVYRDTAGSSSKERQPEKYQQHVLAAMQAVYKTMNPLPCYRGIRDAVEYAMIQLYSYGLTNCLMQKHRLGDDWIVKRQEELRAQKQTCIRGGYDNPYVQNKISESDIQIMELNDKNPQQLYEMVTV